MKLNGKVLPLIALAAVLATTGALAQQNQPKLAKPSGGAQSAMMGGNMADQCKQMMAMHNRMMADMKAMDASLEQKVAAMNASKGNARIDAMAAVINEMASQRKQMVAKMTSMQDQMMAHMGEHVAQSGSAAMRQSMAQCPMVKGMSRQSVMNTKSRVEPARAAMNAGVNSETPK